MDKFKQKRNIKPFDGEKYSIWKFRMRSLLSELNVIDVIDNEIPAIRNEDWEFDNRVAKNMLVEYLSDSYIGFVNDTITAKEVFKNLDSLYERKSLATQLALRKKLLCLKLQGDMSLVKHFTIFDDWITELIAAGARLDETDKVAHLLLTLPGSYDGVITAIETLSEDNLTLVFVKTRLLDHEIKLKNEGGDTSLKVLHIENKGETSKKRKFSDENPISNYPRQNNKRFKGKFKSKFVKCHHCGRKGHTKNDCYYFKRNNNQQNNPDRTRTVQNVQLNQASTPDNFSGFAFMTGEHLQENNANKLTFLLDSGASEHLINRDDFFNVCETLSTPVKMSIAKTNTFISATKRGHINVISDVGVSGVLENVLFSPELPYNLLSVSKMQKAGFTIIFDQDGTCRITKDGEVIMKGDQLADVLTKPLPAVTFQKMRSRMGLK